MNKNQSIKSTTARCPICGSMDGCVPSHGLMRDFPLSVEDWRYIYMFMKYTELPFLHHVALMALNRKNNNANSRVYPFTYE